MIVYYLGEKIVIDKDRLEKILHQSPKLEEVIKRKSQKYITSLEPGDTIEPTSNERRIITYITNNPGCTKQNIVDYFDENNWLSRRPVYNILSKLIIEKIITSTPDEKNSQIHHLFTNDKNLIVTVMRQLDNLSDAFFKLFEKIHELKTSESEMFDFARIVIQVYTHALNTFIAYALLYWPNVIKDDQTTRKLTNLVLHKMSDVLHKISYGTMQSARLKVGRYETAFQYYSPITNGMIANGFLLRPQFLLEIYALSKKMKLENELNNLVNEAWKISDKLYEYSEYGHVPSFLLSQPTAEREVNFMVHNTLEKIGKYDWKYALYNIRKDFMDEKTSEDNKSEEVQNYREFLKDNPELLEVENSARKILNENAKSEI